MLDKEGNVVGTSGNYLYFSYVMEHHENGKEGSAYGWIDLGDGTNPDYDYFFKKDVNLSFDARYLRITGYQDGSQFAPVAMSRMRDDDYNSIRGALNEGQAIYELDRKGYLEWIEMFDHTAQADTSRQLVTVYAFMPNMARYESGDPVTDIASNHYENLLELLSNCWHLTEAGIRTSYSKLNMWDSIILSSASIRDLRNYDTDSGIPRPEPEYTVIAAVRGSPLKMAVQFLTGFYAVSFGVALLGFLYIHRCIRKRLISPLRTIREGMVDRGVNIAVLQDAPVWKEPYELWDHGSRMQDALRESKNEAARLKYELRYAKSAEESRRQMTSNIAHELKTPPAIIHSYAEGLKEHIAEEKRDKYLEIILSEVERTDHMVLEMLDLSRLEAGKVKLSRENFSLIELTKSVFGKLEMATQAKHLQIAYSFPENFQILADEGRIAQVIENYATNAIKYTPVGGNVLVKIQQGRSGVTFRIENDCPPLSKEALSKVWESFYRTDEARSGGGTGLGLAIAKNIVELHGGKCDVCNTESGVEFSFTI